MVEYPCSFKVFMHIFFYVECVLVYTLPPSFSPTPIGPLEHPPKQVYICFYHIPSILSSPVIPIFLQCNNIASLLMV